MISPCFLYLQATFAASKLDRTDFQLFIRCHSSLQGLNSFWYFPKAKWQSESCSSGRASVFIFRMASCLEWIIGPVCLQRVRVKSPRASVVTGLFAERVAFNRRNRGLWSLLHYHRHKYLTGKPRMLPLDGAFCSSQTVVVNEPKFFCNFFLRQVVFKLCGFTASRGGQPRSRQASKPDAETNNWKFMSKSLQILTLQNLCEVKCKMMKKLDLIKSQKRFKFKLINQHLQKTS